MGTFITIMSTTTIITLKFWAIPRDIKMFLSNLASTLDCGPRIYRFQVGLGAIYLPIGSVPTATSTPSNGASYDSVVDEP